MKVEKPDFFKSDEEYPRLDITKDVIQSSVSKSTGEVDSTDDRSEDRSIQDATIGKLAEELAYRYFNQKGYDVEFSDTWRYDLIVDNQTVEVKARDYLQTSPSYKDLLVRDRRDTNWSPSEVDYIVQVMLKGVDGDYGYITGYVEGDKASKADLFHRAKTHRTRKVEHSELNLFPENNL